MDTSNFRVKTRNNDCENVLEFHNWSIDGDFTIEINEWISGKNKSIKIDLHAEEVAALVYWLEVNLHIIKNTTR